MIMAKMKSENAVTGNPVVHCLPASFMMLLEGDSNIGVCIWASLSYIICWRRERLLCPQGSLLMRFCRVSTRCIMGLCSRFCVWAPTIIYAYKRIATTPTVPINLANCFRYQTRSPSLKTTPNNSCGRTVFGNNQNKTIPVIHIDIFKCFSVNVVFFPELG